jgi:hypothetical protein
MPNRRSNRTSQYNARHNEYKRTLGIHSKKLYHLGEFRAKHASSLLTEANEPQSYKQVTSFPMYVGGLKQKNRYSDLFKRLYNHQL